MYSSQAFTPPRTRVVFADLAGPSCGARVSSKSRNRAMQKNSPPAQSPPSSAPSDCNKGSSSSSRPNISPSEHLVRFNPSGSYLGLSDLNPGPTIDSPSLPASGRDLSTPRPSGATPPCWHYLFHIPGEGQDSAWRSLVCCHRHPNRYFKLTVSNSCPLSWICIHCVMSSQVNRYRWTCWYVAFLFDWLCCWEILMLCISVKFHQQTLEI